MEINYRKRNTYKNDSKKYPLATTALQEWYYEMVKCDFTNFNELNRYMVMPVWLLMTGWFSILWVINTGWWYELNLVLKPSR